VVPNLSGDIDPPAGGAEVDLELANAACGVVDTELDIVEDGLVLQPSWRLLPTSHAAGRVSDLGYSEGNRDASA
jgi:hypothetical protein